MAGAHHAREVRMRLLSKNEIGALVRCLSETSQFISKLRDREEIASYVQYPKIPPALSESLAVFAIRENKLLASHGPFKAVKLGGRVADIIATTDSGKTFRIETKAAGTEEFATFGPRDYEADFLLWMLFGDSIRSGCGGKCTVLVCPNPKDHLPWRKDRVTVPQLEADWDGNIEKTFLDIPVQLSGSTNEDEFI